MRYRFITELIDNRLIDVKFVKTEENDSDGFTKNLNGHLYEKHKMKYIVDKEEIKNNHKIYFRSNQCYMSEMSDSDVAH